MEIFSSCKSPMSQWDPEGTSSVILTLKYDHSTYPNMFRNISLEITAFCTLSFYSWISNKESLEPISFFKSININEPTLKSRYRLNPNDLCLSADKREFKSKDSRNCPLILYILNLIEFQESSFYSFHIFPLTFIYM